LSDYLLFKRIVNIKKSGGHLTLEGLQEIINIRASINLGLSEDLKASFPLTEEISRVLVENKNIPSPK
jgi:hypothetical protein